MLHKLRFGVESRKILAKGFLDLTASGADTKVPWEPLVSTWILSPSSKVDMMRAIFGMAAETNGDSWPNRFVPKMVLERVDVSATIFRTIFRCEFFVVNFSLSIFLRWLQFF